jgi:hypothetical protein
MAIVDTKEARLQDRFIRSIRVDSLLFSTDRSYGDGIEVFTYYRGSRHVIVEMRSTWLPFRPQSLTLRRRSLIHGLPTQQIQINVLHKIKEIK